MKMNFRTPANSRWLLVVYWVVCSTRAVTAQCPAGSIINTGGTITNGQTACITTAFSGSIQLNNGATMVVINGGDYTGNLSTNQGSAIQIEAGGRFAPSTANSFSASLTNSGMVVINNISISNGAAITNSGSFTWAGNWNQNSALTVSNTACGTMTFDQGTNMGNNAVILNSGILNFAQGLNTNSGTTINNRGRLTVAGDMNSSGLIYNQHIAVFRGGNNNINSGDSIINLGEMTFSNSVNSSPGMRNEGLFTVGGTFTINSNRFLLNNSNAQLRVNGLNNNAQVQGNGSLYVSGGITNNNSISGYGGGAQQLTVNQSISGTTSNLNVNGGLVAGDTVTYTPTMDNPDACTVLPVKLSSLQAVYQHNQVQLNWTAYAQSNVRSFTIEYSQNAQSFTAAGELMATGDNNQATPYGYTHSPAVTGTVFYRIRETAIDGKVYYSNMVVVKTGNALLATTEVFPNPFAENLQISMQLEKAGMIQIALYDAGGRLIRKLQQHGLAGRNTIAMSSLRALLPGTYLLQIKAGEHTTFEKLIK
ncbi:T9SS type A sorting domain-containing protein [Niastella caeni]|nr:T9SS type A sorting domain-containing protein [Niastella caeni]